MKKETVSNFSESTFLNEDERTSIKKLIDKDGNDSKAIAKLLHIHDCFFDSAISDPLKTIFEFINTAKISMKNISEYLLEDTEDDVFSHMEDETPIFKKVSRKYSVMMAKSNAMPERMQSLQKLISDATEDSVAMIQLHRKYADPDSVNEEEGRKGLSYMDLKHEKLTRQNKVKPK